MVDDAEMPMIQRCNELLIQVKAASVNIVDTKICYGYSKIYRRLLNSGVYKFETYFISILILMYIIINKLCLFIFRNIENSQ